MNGAWESKSRGGWRIAGLAAALLMAGWLVSVAQAAVEMEQADAAEAQTEADEAVGVPLVGWMELSGSMPDRSSPQAWMGEAEEESSLDLM
ncbi:MAG TPA: hypothetical protein VF184_01195, partial [Phycisphaeraceae bacterium]